MGFLDRFLGPKVETLFEQKDVEGLVVLLAHDKSVTRIRAAEALIQLDDERALEPFVRALADQDEEFVNVITGGLRQFGGRAAPNLGAALADEMIAGPALDLLLERRDISTLITTLNDGVDAARPIAGRALIGLMPTLDGGDREQGLHALRAAVGNRSPEIRALAATALGVLKDDRAARALAAQLKDGTEAVREACAGSLQAIGPEAAPELLYTLSDRNANARASAAKVLGALAADIDKETRVQVVEELEKASADREKRVSDEANAALAKYGGDAG